MTPTLQRLRDAYLTHLRRQIHEPAPGKGILPGVSRLLDTLAARDDVRLALLTGNLEAGARVKLEYFNLWHYFGCGAFGDDTPDRNALFVQAMKRVEALEGISPRAGRRRRGRRHAVRHPGGRRRRRQVARRRDRQLRRRRPARRRSGRRPSRSERSARCPRCAGDFERVTAARAGCSAFRGFEADWRGGWRGCASGPNRRFGPASEGFSLRSNEHHPREVPFQNLPE